ncbi:hypothetical protein GM50_5580 [freshwater metagenome]|uniref:Uncharacterized protein n=1 Tax=freshwater metagenome TaxID=449393 RepID=A0A094Q594_9ZZZZ
MANDLFESLRTYINKVSVNEKSAAEIAASVNAWVRESGEAVKVKIEEEVEATVLRVGFVKRSEFDALSAKVAKLEGKPVAKKSSSVKKAATKKAPVKKTAAKKATVKKSTVKKASAKKASK